MGARFWGTLALSLSLCLPAAAKDTITWYLDPSLPPAHIPSGRYAGQGLNDLELKWLIEHLPQFDHVVVDSTAARTWYEIGRTDARCSSAALKTPEREKVAVFSTPALQSWGLMVLVRQDRLAATRDLHGPSENIDLARLLTSDRLRGVINKGRSYGPVIDPLLANAEAQKSVQSVSDSLQALRMVTAGRADYVIGYAMELGYFRKIEGSEEPVVILPIEGVKRDSAAYVACTDQPIGRAVIAAVNEALARENGPPPYMRDAKQWLNDKEYGEYMAPARWIFGDGGRYRD